MSLLVAFTRDSLWLENESTHPCNKALFGLHWHGRLFKGKGIPSCSHTIPPPATRNPPWLTNQRRGAHSIPHETRQTQNVPPLKAHRTTPIYTTPVQAPPTLPGCFRFQYEVVWHSIFFPPPSPLPVHRISRILGRVQKKRKGRQRLCPSNRLGRAQKAPLRPATHDILFASCITPPNQGRSPKMTSNCCWIIRRNLAGTSYSACFRNQRRG